MKGVEQLKEMMIGKVSMFSGHLVLGNQLWLTLYLAAPKTKVISEASKQAAHYDLCRNV
jgi:ribosome biogenesis GTPase